MARKPRFHYSGGMYHVIQRGNNKQTIFQNDEDRHQFYVLLQETLHQYFCKIHSFCLMTNHIHLAIQVGDIPLSKLMHSLSFRYSRWFNWRYQRIGHLFQGRYKAILVEKDSYLLELVRYIHLNPVRAKLIEKAEDYPWSSHRTYLGLENLDWLTTQDVLQMFAPDFRTAQNSYQKFINIGNKTNTTDTKMFRIGNQKRSEILGSDDFMKNLLKSIVFSSKTDYTLCEISDWVCKKFNIEPSSLLETTRHYGHNKLRALVAWLAQNLQTCNLTTAVKYFHRDIATISKIISRIIRNPESKNEWEKLKKEFLEH